MLIVLAANDLEHGIFRSRQYHTILLQLLNGNLAIHRRAAANRIHAEVHIIAILQQIVASLKNTYMRLLVTIARKYHLHSTEENVLNLRACVVKIVLYRRRHHCEIHFREDRVCLLCLRSRNQGLQAIH